MADIASLKEKFMEYVRYNIPYQLSEKALLLRNFQNNRFQIYFDLGHFCVLKNDSIIYHCLYESETIGIVSDLIDEEKEDVLQ